MQGRERTPPETAAFRGLESVICPSLKEQHRERLCNTAGCDGTWKVGGSPMSVRVKEINPNGGPVYTGPGYGCAARRYANSFCCPQDGTTRHRNAAGRSRAPEPGVGERRADPRHHHRVAALLHKQAQPGRRHRHPHYHGASGELSGGSA